MKYSVNSFSCIKEKEENPQHLIQAHRFPHWEKQTKHNDTAIHGVRNHMSDSHSYIKMNITATSCITSIKLL